MVGSGGDGEYGTFTSRSFDFSNLASEGVTGLEVYKTGRASTPSGGIGATINVKTHASADARATRRRSAPRPCSTRASRLAAKSRRRSRALYSWANDSESFGVSLFGSYQKRDSASVGAGNQDWNVERSTTFLDPANGRVRADNPATTTVNEATVINNMPSGNPLVAYPNNSDYWFSEIERERINGQAVLQFRPVESFTITADFLYARTRTRRSVPRRATGSTVRSRASTSTANDAVATAVFLAGITELLRRTSPGASSCARPRTSCSRSA